MRLIGWVLCPLMALAADAVRPTRYELDLRILPKPPTFAGTRTIAHTVDRSPKK